MVGIRHPCCCGKSILCTESSLLIFLKFQLPFLIISVKNFLDPQSSMQLNCSNWLEQFVNSMYVTCIYVQMYQTINLSIHLSICVVISCSDIFYDPINCSPSGSSAYGIFQARILEWVAISFYLFIHPIFCTQFQCIFFPIVVVQSLSHVRLFVTPWTAPYQASLSFTISLSLLKIMSIESVMPSNHLLPPSSLAFNLSQHQGIFQLVDSLHQVVKILEVQP